MNLFRLVSIVAAATAGLIVSARANADCSAPSDCICSNGGMPSYALEVQIPENAELSEAFELEVIAAFGAGVGSVLGDDPTIFEVPTGRVFSDVSIGAGERALLVLGPSAAPLDARRLDVEGDLDCYSADALPSAEVARLALSEACFGEANAGLGPCDDTGCSIGAGPSTSLLLLALLTLTRRRRN